MSRYEKTFRKLEIEKTKKGLPAMWEKGGGWTNTGATTIIADNKGEPKKAIYVRSRGHLACSEHALIVLEKGDYIVKANHHRHDFEITIYKVVDFVDETIKENYAGEHLGKITKEELLEKYGKKFEELEYSNIDFAFRVLSEETLLYGYSSDTTYDLYKLATKEKTFHYCIVEEVNKFNMGEWDTEVPESLTAAIKAAKEKATCYHCRSAHYIKTK